MGLNFDFSMNDQQKKIAVLAGIGAAILGVVFLFFAFRGPSFDMAHLKDLENSGRTITDQDLERLAPLLHHPDDKVRQKVAGYFTGAPPTVISSAVRQSRSMDPRARRILEARYIDNAPSEAVAYLASELNGAGGDRAQDILSLLGQAKTPDAAPYILAAIENAPDETSRTAASSAISTNEHLHTDQAKNSLERIINDENRTQRERSHALRARNSMSGRPYQPGMSPDGKMAIGGGAPVVPPAKR